MSGRTALVTGATGFVGRATCAALAGAGWRVLGAVRAPDRLAQLPPSAEGVVLGDLGEPEDRSAALAGVDVVVHLAARVHVMRDRVADADAVYHRANVGAATALARSAAAAGVRRFVYVSSVKAIAEGGAAPLPEDVPPAPRDAYGRSKLAAERALLALGRETGLEIVILRPPLVYGAGVKGNFARLIKLVRLARLVPLPLGAARGRRSLVYVENLADALRVAAEHPAAAGGTFHVRDADLTTPELVRQLGTALGVRPRLVSVPPALLRGAARALGRGDEVERLVGALQLDDSALRTRLGWAPPVPLDLALRRTVGSDR